MNNNELLVELEMLYHKFLNAHNFEKAQEILMKIADIKGANESAKYVPDQNILLG